jgi:hypothetical protein
MVAWLVGQMSEPRRHDNMKDSNTPNPRNPTTRHVVPLLSALQHGEAGFLLGDAATCAAGSEVVAATLRLPTVLTVRGFFFFTP